MLVASRPEHHPSSLSLACDAGLPLLVLLALNTALAILLLPSRRLSDDTQPISVTFITVYVNLST